MSKAQGDGYKTWTNVELNKYYDNVFRPKLLEMENYQEKRYEINGGAIICEQKNIVERDGWKLKSLKITGREYTIRVYSDSNSLISDVVERFTDKDKSNERFLFWKAQLEM